MRYLIIALGDGSVIGTDSLEEAGQLSNDSYYTVIDCVTQSLIRSGQIEEVKSLQQRTEIEGGQYLDPNEA